MPNAVITSSTFTGDGTQLKIMNELNTAMVALGFTQLDSFLATGNEQRVWEFDAAPLDTSFGKMIIQGGFSGPTTIQLRGFSSFNTAGNTGANESPTATSSVLVLTSSFTLYTCNHPEVRGVILQEGTTLRKFFGYLRPISKPPLWGDAPYGFIDAGGGAYTSETLQPISALRPGSVTTNIRVNGYANNGGQDIAIWGNRPFLTNCLLTDQGSIRPIAFFSNDIITAGNNGMNMLQQYFDPTNNATYTIFDAIGNNTARMAIRTA